jgi:hypothetical protein
MGSVAIDAMRGPPSRQPQADQPERTNLPKPYALVQFRAREHSFSPAGIAHECL